MEVCFAMILAYLPGKIKGGIFMRCMFFPLPDDIDCFIVTDIPAILINEKFKPKEDALETAD